jgi:NDP-sugar pyrophosphorylase family protein
MQIIIPMSGTGDRFIRAGYATPKPLIEIDGRPMIAHVIDLFPGETDLTFVCNEDHLAQAELHLADVLRRACPTAKIVGIAPHKRGPVHAVLQALDGIDALRPVVVNYCDFAVYWDWENFKSFVGETGCDGAIPAYRGFHPHSLRGGFYAFLQEQGLWLRDIREKRPFTSDPMSEYASSGTYFFRSGALMRECFEEAVASDLSVGGEFYVSLAYKPLLSRGGRVAVYELQHFMQWGTPEDLHDYQTYSRLFAALVSDSGRARQEGAVMVPAAGAGSRFARAGYRLPKPLIEVSGRPMLVQALADLPEANRRVVILSRESLGDVDDGRELGRLLPSTRVVWVPALTEGQAATCLAGLDAVDPDEPLTIGACDNGLVYDVPLIERLLGDARCDLLVWGIRGHPEAMRRPQYYSWIDVDRDARVTAISEKQPLPRGSTRSDPIVVGTFTFRRAADFRRCFDRLRARDGRINGEFYVDSVVNDAIALGLGVRFFEIIGYAGWGTPEDLKTFEYWQSCFHKLERHPYRLERDRHVPAEKLPDLLRDVAQAIPRRPT